MPTAVDLVTDLPADFEVFGQAVATSMADLLGGTTGQILSKTSNTDMDFTWINNDQGDITGVTAGTGISGGGTSGTVTVTNSMATAIDAKGDLIGGTGADTFARLAVGTNGQVLTADSAETTGLKWATPASGSGLTLITSQAFTTSTAVNVNNVFSSTYNNYRLIFRTTATTSGGDMSITMRLRLSGTDATTNYIGTRLFGYGTTTGAEEVSTWYALDCNPTFPVQAAVMDIYNPAVASRTTATGQYAKINNAGLNISIASGSSHSTATAYDGFSLIPGSGNITGTVEVYGYAK